jgi:phosphatidate cytidylyltransferase
LIGNTHVSPLFFDLFAVLLCLVCVYEMHRVLKQSGCKVIAAPLILLSLFIYPAYLLLGTEGMLSALFVAAAAAGIKYTLTPELNFADLAKTVFMMLYPLSLVAMAFIINHELGGTLAILLVLGISVFSDAFAYLVGSALKGKKLIPSISPKKTISGAIGGLFGGMAAATALYFLAYYAWPNALLAAAPDFFWEMERYALPIFIAMGLIGAALTQLGDLLASRIKREFGIKDFGTLIPEHGGMMDRLDGIIINIMFIFVSLKILEWVFLI